jgi:hypothetical protein
MKNLYKLAISKDNNQPLGILNERNNYVALFPSIEIPAGGVTKKYKNDILKQTKLAEFITMSLNKRRTWLDIVNPIILI